MFEQEAMRMADPAPVKADAPQVRLPVIGIICLIAAAAGGGFSAPGFSFSALNGSSRILVAILGAALIIFEYRHQIVAQLPILNRRVLGIAALVTGALAIVGIVGLIAERRFIAPEPPLEKIAGEFVPPQLCPVRTDSPAPANVGTFWINVGIKNQENSDALDAARNIVEPCAPRTTDTATIYRTVHVWQGIDPGEMIKGALSVRETDEILRPGAKIEVVGGLSGLKVMNAKGEFLYFEVWAPIRVL